MKLGNASAAEIAAFAEANGVLCPWRASAWAGPKVPEPSLRWLPEIPTVERIETLRDGRVERYERVSDAEPIDPARLPPAAAVACEHVDEWRAAAQTFEAVLVAQATVTKATRIRKASKGDIAATVEQLLFEADEALKNMPLWVDDPLGQDPMPDSRPAAFLTSYELRFLRGSTPQPEPIRAMIGLVLERAMRLGWITHSLEPHNNEWVGRPTANSLLAALGIQAMGVLNEGAVIFPCRNCLSLVRAKRIDAAPYCKKEPCQRARATNRKRTSRAD